jgi:hypothetical protein
MANGNRFVAYVNEVNIATFPLLLEFLPELSKLF